MLNRRALGEQQEHLAKEWLTAQGYQILEQNFRCRQGEIDLIGRDGRYLVFIEVKYRKDSRCGDPLEAVDRRKQERILLTARFYLRSRGYSELTPCRFDIVAVRGENITVLKNAFGI